MDILELIDRLEDLFNQSHSIPFTHSVIVDEDRMLDIIDQMRVSIPDEIKKSQQIINQREKYLAQAQEEASRITSIARERSAKAITQEEIVQEAKRAADEIIAEAELERTRIQQETDDYIVSELQNFREQLHMLMQQVSNGIETVRSSKDTATKD
jgi:cell division septum initiation protein DivIVA